MKLIIQIPCFNEEETLESVVKTIPKKINGIDIIETLVINDGSTDKTVEIAEKLGITHIISNNRNLGLARTFARGLEESIKQGADIIINTDGDNQYPSKEIENLIVPILNGDADIVIGDRGGMNNPHFSYFKRKLQVLGSKIISFIIGANVPDAVSGFRAISRHAAKEINILTSFSYTIEMLIQATHRNFSIASVAITTNAKTRDSRLFKNIPQFLKMSGMTFLRVYTMYKPLKVFVRLGVFITLIGFIPFIRFLYFYFSGDGSGHIQSLVIGGAMISIGFFTIMLGIIADLISFNRKLTEKLLSRIESLEEKLSDKKIL